MEPDEHLEAGQKALAAGEYDEARQHFRAAIRLFPSDEKYRDALHDALKYDYWWVSIFRHFGLLPPGSATGEEPWSHIAFWAIVGVIPMLCLKLIRTDPTFWGPLWSVVVACALILIFSRLTDYAATIRLWSTGQYSGWIITRGELAGAWAGLSLMVFAATCAVATLFSGLDFGWVFTGMILFLAARPIQLALKTRRGLPRWLVTLYVGLVVGMGVISEVLALSAGNRFDWDAKLPAEAGWLFLGFILGVLLTRVFRAVVLEILGKHIDFLDSSTTAESPGAISLSDASLRKLHPELYGFRSLFHALTHRQRGISARDARAMIRQHLLHGDSNPAVVLSTDPVLIAAYAEDLDCIVVLEFENWLVEEYHLTRGQRMLSVNTFMEMSYRELGNDLVWGPNHTDTWGNTCPFIAELLSDDAEAIRKRKAAISAEDWQRLVELARTWKRRPNAPTRDGRPLSCNVSRDAL